MLRQLTEIKVRVIVVDFRSYIGVSSIRTDWKPNMRNVRKYLDKINGYKSLPCVCWHDAGQGSAYSPTETDK